MTVALLELALGCGDKAGDSASSGTYTVHPATYMFLASAWLLRIMVQYFQRPGGF